MWLLLYPQTYNALLAVPIQPSAIIVSVKSASNIVSLAIIISANIQFDSSWLLFYPQRYNNLFVCILWLAIIVSLATCASDKY